MGGAQRPYQSEHVVYDGYGHESYREKDKNCFIATAAYGSPMMEELDTLRGFRDETLLEKRLGEVLVRAYYIIGPYFAKAIEMSDGARGLVRRMLDPVVKHLQKK